MKSASTALALIPDVEPAFARAQRLQAEAREAVEEHVSHAVETLTSAVTRCREIAQGGDLYPAGIRDLAGRLADQISTGRDTMEAIAQAAANAAQRRALK